MDKRPNILYFVADQMRADTQHYLGNEASITPNLDALAKEGVAFENAYCQNPVCVPSRCSFLSGTYPHTTGHRTMHFLLNNDEPNILRIMKNAGYEVIWIGRNDIVSGDRTKEEYCDAYYDGITPEDTKDQLSSMHKHTKGEAGGMIEHFTKDMYSFYFGKVDEQHSGKADVGCVKACIDYLNNKRKQGNDKPFFVYCTLMYPHPPYAVCEPWYSSIDREKVKELWPRKKWVADKPSMIVKTADKMELHDWSEDRWAELRATYLAMTSKFDSQLGEVVNCLKENEFYDDTSIFVFSDHGDYTGDYDIVEKVQNCFEDDLSNIPLIVKPAKQFECKPRVTPALAELVDLTATVSDMTGVELNYVQYGKSLMDVLSGSDVHKDAVFCEGGRVHGDLPSMEIGHHDPRDVYWPRISTQQEEGPEHTKATMIRMGNLKYTRRLYEKDELYDLDKDPDEMVNRIDDPEYAEDIRKMQERMLSWYQETADWVPNRKDVR